jgi:hypothetical protein
VTGRPGKPRSEQDQIGGRLKAARQALGYRSLEAPGNRRRRQMVTVPQGTQNPAYSPPSVHQPVSNTKRALYREIEGSPVPICTHLSWVLVRTRNLLSALRRPSSNSSRDAPNLLIRVGPQLATCVKCLGRALMTEPLWKSLAPRAGTHLVCSRPLNRPRFDGGLGPPHRLLNTKRAPGPETGRHLPGLTSKPPVNRV